MDSSLEHLVREWLRLDNNESTRTEIRRLLVERNFEELDRPIHDVNGRLRIEFGTAGLRGKMEAGWSRMNDLIIMQTSQGLCAYVLKMVSDAANKGVVIAHDHRHNSEYWASLAATAFLNQGVKVYLHQGLNHTPMVPFSVSKLGAACGVMITASHNPKQDNGYKVYWENAVQIVAPHDAGISEAIASNSEPQYWDIQLVKSSSLCINRTVEMRQAYFNHLADLSTSRIVNPMTSIKFVNTSMHGVGHIFAVQAFEVFGLPPFTSVKAQESPDPEFSTVKFPNPEEKGMYPSVPALLMLIVAIYSLEGALDLAMIDADVEGASYILAQDPDADRFAAAEKGPAGKWIVFTGDQLGAIFAARALAAYKASGKPLNKLAMVASTVSSKMIEAMSIEEGFKFVECLTGFKYIGNTALQLVSEGYEVPFAYEEAIGYMLGSIIRDKDGIAATACFAELASTLATSGSSVSTFLQTLYDRYGYFKTSNSYFLCNEPSTIDRIFTRLRNFDGQTSERNSIPSYPKIIAGLKVISVRDLTVGFDSANPPTFKPTLPLSSGHMIQIRARSETDDAAIVLTTRTSGTEPKIKYYLEGIGGDVTVIDSLLPKVIAELRDHWLEAAKNKLGSP